jgi:hypothetical protein
MRQHGFAALGTGAQLGRSYSIMGSALVFFALRGPSLRYRHLYKSLLFFPPEAEETA